MTPQTVTSLKRWSCLSKELPAVSEIRAIHIYDFDNTLFASPLPNPRLWNGPTIGLLQGLDVFNNGGWWHDVSILKATGEGIEEEEPRAWEGWWNEQIVSLVRLTVQQKDALCILLTGRAEGNFADVIKRMVATKGLDFDMICLKPAVGPYNQRFANTMAFKQALLEDVIYTYREAEELRIYEDRTKHVKGFRDFLAALNQALHINELRSRAVIRAEVIHVTDPTRNLDPVRETAEVQRMINEHNASITDPRQRRLQIKRTISYTGYLIPPVHSRRLLSLVELPSNVPEGEVKPLANNILISPRPCSKSTLEKVGDFGTEVTWEVTGTAVLENRVWAAAVRPVPEGTRYYTENPAPIVVLALRKGARPVDAGRIERWQAISKDKSFTFPTTVGEKVLLRVEEERGSDNEWESLFAPKEAKWRHSQDADPYSYGGPRAKRGSRSSDGYRGGSRGVSQHGYLGRSRGHRGGANHRASGRGGTGRGRGRGGPGASAGPAYRSYDDPSAGWNGSSAGYSGSESGHGYVDLDSVSAPAYSYRQGA